MTGFELRASGVGGDRSTEPQPLPFIHSNLSPFEAKLKLIIDSKMAYCGCFTWGGNLDFPDYLKEKFNNIDNWTNIIQKISSWQSD